MTAAVIATTAGLGKAWRRGEYNRILAAEAAVAETEAAAAAGEEAGP